MEVPLNKTKKTFLAAILFVLTVLLMKPSPSQILLDGMKLRLSINNLAAGLCLVGALVVLFIIKKK